MQREGGAHYQISRFAGFIICAISIKWAIHYLLNAILSSEGQFPYLTGTRAVRLPATHGSLYFTIEFYYSTSRLTIQGLFCTAGQLVPCAIPKIQISLS